jgi:hypothetical protein
VAYPLGDHTTTGMSRPYGDFGSPPQAWQRELTIQSNHGQIF